MLTFVRSYNFEPRHRLLWLRAFPSSVLGPVLAPPCQIANALIEADQAPKVGQCYESNPTGRKTGY